MYACMYVTSKSNILKYRKTKLLFEIEFLKVGKLFTVPYFVKFVEFITPKKCTMHKRTIISRYDDDKIIFFKQRNFLFSFFLSFSVN